MKSMKDAATKMGIQSGDRVWVSSETVTTGR
jgi:anaerobic selenocysteine-containing dehydrogenase